MTHKRINQLRLLLMVLLMAWLLPTATPAVQAKSAQADEIIRFTLNPVGRFAECFARYPGDDRRVPYAEVIVKSRRENDRMFLRLYNFKPQVNFDLFTVERSLFLADGSTDPNFKGFGFAWYQSDIEVISDGTADVEIDTILLNQIFGFNPDVGLAPTNTFHVGFWFNDPNDAAPCGFDVNNPTPFNGEHKAGPLAMMSVPNAQSNLGPLCTKPNWNTSPVSCDP